MAKNRKRKGSATVKAKARKAKAHVTAKRVARVAKKTMRIERQRRPQRRDEIETAGAAFAATGATSGQVVVPPDTDSGMGPSEEKQVLDALDEDAREVDEGEDND